MTIKTALHRYLITINAGIVAFSVGLALTFYNVNIPNLFGGQASPATPPLLIGLGNWIFAITIGFALGGLIEITHENRPKVPGGGRGK